MKATVMLTLLLMAVMWNGAQAITLSRFDVAEGEAPPPAQGDYLESVTSAKNMTRGALAGTSAEELRTLINGHYYNQSYLSASIATRYWTRVSVDDSNEVTISNLMGKGTTVSGTLDASRGIVSVPVQKLFSEDEYGDFYCVNVDIAEKKYYVDRPLEFEISADGTLTLGNWGAFVLSGSYKGYSTIRYAEVMTPARAEITDYSMTRTPAVNTYPAVYIRENNHRALITNFYNFGADVIVDINSDGSASVARGALAYGKNASGSTITYYNYSVSSYTSTSSYKLASTATSATFAGDSIVTSMWALSTNTTISNVYDLLEKTVIKVPEKFVSYSNDLNLKGSGTLSDPYLIASAQDLVNLSDATNYSGKYVTSKKCFTGVYFLQTADIDMATVPNFEPIGNTTNVTFNGRYDGGGHSISNLTINRRASQYAGLFGILESAGCVKNISFISPVLTTEANYASVVTGKSSGVIENVKVTDARLKGANYLSGIAGSFAGSMKHCSFQGTIDGQNYTGGLVGMGWGNMSNCESSADITTGRTGCIVGGLGGSLAGDTLVVADCCFTGTITDKNGSGTYGGLFGYFQNGRVTRSISTGHIESKSVATNTTVIGGLLGLLANATIDDCAMSGQIISPDAPTVGGLVGKVTKRTGSGDDLPIIANCLLTGVIQISPDLKDVEFVSADTVIYLTVKGCVYDKIVSGRGGKSDGGVITGILTSGERIGSLTGDVWTFTPGCYPSITSLLDSDAGRVQQSAALFAAGDTPASVQKTISLGGRAKWYLLKDGKISTEGHGLKIENNNAVMTAAEVTSDTLVAVSGTSAKYYYLKVLPKEYDGDGTAESPFIIKSRADIYRLRNAVDYNGVRYTGLHFRLANDIDMGGGRGFIGLSGTGPDACFNGTFDGAGYKIKNWIADRVELDGMTPTVEGSSNLMAGFFLYLGPEGVVKNLIIDSSCSIMAGSHVAAIVSQNYGLVENCRNHAPVWGMNNYIGGIVDYNAEGAIVRRCYNDAKVQCGRSMAGGIVAYNYGTVEECQNDGEMYNGVISTSYPNISVICGAGGIVGYNYGIVLDCMNGGAVTSPKQGGGIVGQNKETGRVDRCVNTGLITITLDSSTSGAVIGNQLNVKDSCTLLYYDRQISWPTAADNKAFEGAYGLTTKALTDGSVPEGLNDEVWCAESGRYPVLMAFNEEASARFNAGTYLKFQSDSRTDSRFYMRRNATLSIPEGTNAMVKQNVLSLNGKMLNFGSNLTEAVDTVVFACGELIKEIPVFASAKVLPNGSGTSEDPWQIRDADEWNTLAGFSDAHDMDFSDDSFAITAPLDFKGKTFHRLCSKGSVAFQGVIDGRGFTIDNIAVDDTTSASQYNGLIRALGADGCVKNIIIGSGSNIKARIYVGAIAGSTAGLIENCVNHASVGSYLNYAGGIAGFVNAGGRFVKCENTGTITAETGIAGGIAGGSNAEIGGLIDSCTNRGSVSGSRIAGGLIGSSRVSIANSVNYGTVDVTSEGYGGGIVGYHTYDIPITGCENHGKVTTVKAQAGGIVGYLFSGAAISRCTNYGEIIAGTNCSGGIVGQSYKGSVRISDCVNHGQITSTTTYAGGIAGSLAAGTSDNDLTILSRVANYGDITSTSSYAGGIVGAAPAFTRHYQLANYGKVYGDLFVGGCFGQLLGKADTCLNVGDVTSKRYTVGGIIGTTASTTTVTARIDNALNVGKVKSESTTVTNRYNIGGILGGGNIKMYNCVNIADLEGYKAVGGLVGAVCKGAYSTVYKETYYGTCIYNSYSVGQVECADDGLEATVGHLIGTSSAGYTFDYMELCNLQADRQQMGPRNFVLDSVAGMRTPQELTAALMGDAFIDMESTSCYPVLKAFEDNETARLYASALKFDNSEWTRNGVGGAFHVRAPQGVEWKSDRFDINSSKNLVSWTSLTPGTEYSLYAESTVGQREFRLVLLSGTNVDTLSDDIYVTSREYFTPDGVRFAKVPTEGVYLEITVMSDGSRVVRKIVK